jgi:hypothetical protein
LKAYHVDLDHLEKIDKLLAWHSGLPTKPHQLGRGVLKATKKRRR